MLVCALEEETLRGTGRGELSTAFILKSLKITEKFFLKHLKLFSKNKDIFPIQAQFLYYTKELFIPLILYMYILSKLIC